MSYLVALSTPDSLLEQQRYAACSTVLCRRPAKESKHHVTDRISLDFSGCNGRDRVRLLALGVLDRRWRRRLGGADRRRRERRHERGRHLRLGRGGLDAGLDDGREPP